MENKKLTSLKNQYDKKLKYCLKTLPKIQRLNNSQRHGRADTMTKRYNATHAEMLAIDEQRTQMYLTHSA